MEKRVALIGIVVEDMESVEALNHILHEYGDYIIGRMGIPYRCRGISIISIAVDAPMNVISTISGSWECSMASVSKPSIQRLGRQNDVYT